MNEWTYCRNCVAWRDRLYSTAKGDEASEKKVCRRRCDARYLTGPDDGCCEGVPKVGNAGGGK